MPQSKSRRSHYRPLYSCKITKLKPILCHFRHALETSPILVKAKDGAAPAAAASWGHGRTIAALLLCCCHQFTWQLKSFSIPWCSPPRTKTSWWSTGSAEHLHGALHGAHGESSQKWFLVLRIILKKKCALRPNHASIAGWCQTNSDVWYERTHWRWFQSCAHVQLFWLLCSNVFYTWSCSWTVYSRDFPRIFVRCSNYLSCMFHVCSPGFFPNAPCDLFLSSAAIWAASFTSWNQHRIWS